MKPPEDIHTEIPDAEPYWMQDVRIATRAIEAKRLELHARVDSSPVQTEETQRIEREGEGENTP